MIIYIFQCNSNARCNAIVALNLGDPCSESCTTETYNYLWVRYGNCEDNSQVYEPLCLVNDLTACDDWTCRCSYSHIAGAHYSYDACIQCK